MSGGMDMRWFKLDTDYIRDDKVDECIDQLGHRGVHIWMALMAEICKRWNGDNLDETVIIPVTSFRRSCRITKATLDDNLAKLQRIFDFSATITEGNLEVAYPKLLKKQGKYIKAAKKGVKKLETDIDIDIDIDKDTDINNISLPAIAEKKRPKAPNSKPTWEVYIWAYTKRYGVPPVRNATVNSQMLKFIKRVGAQDAPDIAAFYVAHNDQFYVRKSHSVGLLLNDAEKLSTEWRTNNVVTTSDARDVERRHANVKAIEGGVNMIQKLKGLTDEK